MTDDKTARAKEILKRLKKLYPEPIVELDFTTPFELMIAAILAAQNRDTNINKITPALFRKYKGPSAYVAVDTAELEHDIAKSGFFRQKTKALKAVSQKLLDDFGGKVPDTMDELLSLPGVGRKTANAVLSFAMGKAEGIVVDVHHLRVEPRLGMSMQKTADKMEAELLKIVAKKDWIMWSSSITLHGRRVCTARKPKCSTCVLGPDICPSYMKIDDAV
jgi:endonuclease-3